MTRRRVPTTAVLSMALQLVVSFGITARLVLCHSPQGHVAVESSLGGDCCTSEYPAAAALGGIDACDGCTDTPLLRANVDRRTADHGLRPSPSGTIVFPVMPATTPTWSSLRAAIAAEQLAAASPPPFLPSVVLLI